MSSGEQQPGELSLARRNLLEERARAFAENYEQEAELLEKVISHMDREKGLIRVGDFAALNDSLAGRGELVDEIARVEARRRDLEAEYSSLWPRQARESPPPPDVCHTGVAEEAQRKAAAAHRRAVQMDEELRETLRTRKVEVERALVELAQGRAANRAYSNGQNGYGTASVFLDKER